MINEGALLEKLAEYLHNQISLNEFEDWFVQASWNAHLDSDPASFKLVSVIELKLAEYSSGHLPETDLIQELSALTSPRFVYFSIPKGSGQAVITGASNPSLFQAVVEPSGAIFSAEYV